MGFFSLSLYKLKQNTHHKKALKLEKQAGILQTEKKLEYPSGSGVDQIFWVRANIQRKKLRDYVRHSTVKS